MNKSKNAIYKYWQVESEQERKVRISSLTPSMAGGPFIFIIYFKHEKSVRHSRTKEVKPYTGKLLLGPATMSNRYQSF